MEGALLGGYSLRVELTEGSRLDLDRSDPFLIGQGVRIDISARSSSSSGLRRLNTAVSRIVLDGRGASRLFDVRGELHLEGIELINGRAQQGGALFIFSGGSVTLDNSRISNSVAVGTSFGDADGGAVHIDPNGKLTLTDSEIINCAAINEDAIGGVSRGGGIFSQGSVELVSSTLSSCNATSAFASGGQGGGLLIASAGTAMLSNRTTLHGNTASGIASNILLEEGGTITYQLPAPPGYWIAGRGMLC